MRATKLLRRLPAGARSSAPGAHRVRHRRDPARRLREDRRHGCGRAATDLATSRRCSSTRRTSTRAPRAARSRTADVARSRRPGPLDDARAAGERLAAELEADAPALIDPSASAGAAGASSALDENARSARLLARRRAAPADRDHRRPRREPRRRLRRSSRCSSRTGFRRRARSSQSVAQRELARADDRPARRRRGRRQSTATRVNDVRRSAIADREAPAGHARRRRDGKQRTLAPADAAEVSDRRLLGFGFEFAHDGPPDSVAARGDVAEQELWLVTTGDGTRARRPRLPGRATAATSTVGIVRASPSEQSLHEGTTCELLALISLSLAIFNLLPFLPLDGGHVLCRSRARAAPPALARDLRARLAGRHRADGRALPGRAPAGRRAHPGRRARLALGAAGYPDRRWQASVQIEVGGVPIGGGSRSASSR